MCIPRRCKYQMTNTQKLPMCVATLSPPDRCLRSINPATGRGTPPVGHGPDVALRTMNGAGSRPHREPSASQQPFFRRRRLDPPPPWVGGGRAVAKEGPGPGRCPGLTLRGGGRGGFAGLHEELPKFEEWVAPRRFRGGGKRIQFP